MRRPLLWMLLAALGPCVAFALKVQPRLLHPPGAGFSCEIPQGWARGPDAAEGLFVLLAQGPAPTFRPLISIERRRGVPDYFRGTSRSWKIGGVAARRFQAAFMRRPLAMDVRPNIPTAPVKVMRDQVLTVNGGQMWRISLSAPAERFLGAQADFEQVLRSFSFEQEPR